MVIKEISTEIFKQNASSRYPIYKTLPLFEQLVLNSFEHYSSKHDAAAPDYTGALFVKFIMSSKAWSDDIVLTNDHKMNTRKKIFIENLQSFMFDSGKRLYDESNQDPKQSSILEDLEYEIMQYSPLSLARKILSTGKVNNFKKGIISETYSALNSEISLSQIRKALLSEPSDAVPRFREYNGLARRIRNLYN